MMTQVSDRKRWSSILTLSVVMLLSVVCIIMLFCDDASAAAEPGTVDTILKTFHDKSSLIGTKIEQYAKWLFWCLAIIEFSWAAIQVGVRGEMSLGALWSMVFKQMMLIGIFWWLLQKWPDLAKTIVGGLGQDMANAVGGSNFSPADVLSKGVDAFFLNVEAGWKAGWSDFVAGILAGVVIFLAMALAAGALCVYMVEWYVGIPIGVMILGLGGSSWTKSYVESYIRFLISLGFKILSVKIVLMIIMEYLDQVIKDMETSSGSPGFLTAGATLASLSVIAYMLIQQIPGIASSMLSGSSMQSGASTLTSAVGGAAGNIKSAANAAQSIAKGATSAGASMAGVAKRAGGAASSAASYVDRKLGGDGTMSGGNDLKSALRGHATVGAALVGATASVAMSAGGAAARWAGVGGKKEDPMLQMAKNVAAIANKLGVNDPPKGNEIKPGGASTGSPNSSTGNGGTSSNKPDNVDGSREEANNRMKGIEDATNEKMGQGDQA